MWLARQLKHSRAGGLAGVRNSEMQGSLASLTLFQTHLALGGTLGAAHHRRADGVGPLVLAFEGSALAFPRCRALCSLTQHPGQPQTPASSW